MLMSPSRNLFDDLEHISLENSPKPYSSSIDDQRKYPRTYYQDKIPILLRLRNENGEFFQPSSFLLNESFHGVALLVFTMTHLSKNQLCEVNLIDTDWISSRIAWCREIGESCQEIGISYRF